RTATTHHRKDRQPPARRYSTWLRWLARATLGAAAGLALLFGRSARQPAPPTEPLRSRPDREPSPPTSLPPDPEHEEIHYSDGRIEHPSVQYEPSDARFRGV